MKIIIFGASGKTGVKLVKQSLEQGHSVTAFVRNPEKLAIENENLTFATGDAFDPASVSQAVQGQDAVICVLGSGTDLKKTMIRAKGTINIVNAMQKNNIRRLMVVTAMGVAESWEDLSLFNKFIFAVLMKNIREDHEAQEASIKESSLDWTIVRPSGLTDTPRTGIYSVGENIPAITSRISRADVADLILKELIENALIGKAVTITN